MKSTLFSALNRRFYVVLSVAIVAVSSTSSAAPPSKHILAAEDLSGTWSGREQSGAMLTFSLSPDGYVSISRDGETVFGGGEGSAATWRLAQEGKQFGLDLIFSNEFGATAEAKYLIRAVGDHAIELRFGGFVSRRPASFGEPSDPMRLILVREAPNK